MRGLDKSCNALPPQISALGIKLRIAESVRKLMNLPKYVLLALVCHRSQYASLITLPPSLPPSLPPCLTGASRQERHTVIDILPFVVKREEYLAIPIQAAPWIRTDKQIPIIRCIFVGAAKCLWIDRPRPQPVLAINIDLNSNWSVVHCTLYPQILAYF